MAKKTKNTGLSMPALSPSLGKGFVSTALELERQKAGLEAMDTFSAFAQPKLTDLEQRSNTIKEARTEFINNLPEDYDFELVTPELKPKLTQFLSTKKQEYLRFAEQASKYANNPSSQQYIDAVEKMEGVKSSMNKAYEQFALLKNKRQAYKDNSSLIADFTDEEGLNYSKRLNGIVDGTSFDNLNIQEDGSILIDDGFGEATSLSQFKDPYLRNTKGSEQLNNFTLIKPYNLGLKGTDRSIVESQLRQEMGALFENENFAKEIYQLGAYGDATGATKGSLMAKSPQEMINGFINIAMDSYDKGLRKSKGTTETYDYDSALESLDAGDSVNLANLTGDKKDANRVIRWNPQRNGYESLNRDGKPLPEFGLMTREQLGIRLGVKLSEVGSGLGPVFGGSTSNSEEFNISNIVPQPVNNDFAK